MGPERADKEEPTTWPSTDEEWRNLLTPQQYQILRGGLDEASGSGEYLRVEKNGTYQCRGCHANLFHSSAKYSGGAGWPQFKEALDAAVVDSDDGEVRCATCMSHLGWKPDEYLVNSMALELRYE